MTAPSLSHPPPPSSSLSLASLTKKQIKNNNSIICLHSHNQHQLPIIFIILYIIGVYHAGPMIPPTGSSIRLLVTYYHTTKPLFIFLLS